jgi:hypothetical protein
VSMCRGSWSSRGSSDGGLIEVFTELVFATWDLVQFRVFRGSAIPAQELPQLFVLIQDQSGRWELLRFLLLIR